MVGLHLVASASRSALVSERAVLEAGATLDGANAAAYARRVEKIASFVLLL